MAPILVQCSTSLNARLSVMLAVIAAMAITTSSAANYGRSSLFSSDKKDLGKTQSGVFLPRSTGVGHTLETLSALQLEVEDLSPDEAEALMASDTAVNKPTDKLKKFNPFAKKKELKQGSDVENCNEIDQVHSGSEKSRRCPASCPLYVERAGNPAFCDFECVPATVDACMTSNPRTPVVDKERGICRACMVDGCSTCMNDGTDMCAKCKMGYRLSGGYCYNKYRFLWLFALLVLLVIFGLVVLYVVQLGLRRVTNQQGLNEGLAARSRAKLHMPKEDGRTERNLWPLTTNLLTQPIAGPGMLLNFNFQFVIIVWALGVAFAWSTLADYVDPELLELGMHPARGTRDNCIVVAHGYETQRRLIWAKEYFCYGLYVVSFLLAILHAVRQLRNFQVIDQNSTTHKDYACLLTGLPQLPGTEKVEEDLKKTLSESLKMEVVGVSVCWDFVAHEDAVMEAVEELLDDAQDAEGGSRPASPRGLTPRMSPRMSPREKPMSEEERIAAEEKRLRELVPGTFWESIVKYFHIFRLKFDQAMQIVERTFLSPTSQKIMKRKVRKPKKSQRKKSGDDHGAGAAGEEEEPEQDMEEILKNMKTCIYAFVVFDSEHRRDAAVEECERLGGIEYREKKLVLSKAIAEPDTVIWKNCAFYHVMDKVKSVLFGLLSIFGALCVWGGCFYLPYAYFVMSFNYAHGQEPTAWASLTFSMLVCGGNAVMYFVCSEVAERVGFKYEDNREVCYMLLYAFACTLNVLLDLVTTYFVAYQMMVGQDFRTYDGTPLHDVDTFTERFETYAMQRSLGNNLMDYAFPSTFLIPFMIEPLVAIVVPYTLMRFIVRSHPEIIGNLAESYLMCTPMDLSRYADLHLNLMLAVLVFYFPPGFVVKMFVALGMSHMFIYAYDHYRLLRSVPACDFASMDVDWWATWMFSIPCGLLLSCAVFKANCQPDHHCVTGIWLILKCTAAFIFHVILHTWVLRKVVPKLGKVETTPVEDTYEQCAQRLPFSWFNQNPVFCLRSYIIYEHDPPCLICTPGKEHLQKVNKSIGCYFTEEPAKVEEFDPQKFVHKNLEETKKQLESLKRQSSARFEDLKKASTEQYEAFQQKVAAWKAGGSEGVSPTAAASREPLNPNPS
eukprot:TRINITY_DN25617_c0_g1_i1.p1 TRINITY_DN25617_c0_g1~~TRINITY_DN25617_c0_g1_i1.p1  ORF type:complete len:1144 (-),score=266.30 TRINITY_DN25617_c0_g1_i1:22-3390(-)